MRHELARAKNRDFQRELDLRELDRDVRKRALQRNPVSVLAASRRAAEQIVRDTIPLAAVEQAARAVFG